MGIWNLLQTLVWMEFGVKLGNGKTAQHSVHPTGGSLRVFKHFSWLEFGSVKVALSRPTHQRVTRAVGRLIEKNHLEYLNISILKRS